MKNKLLSGNLRNISLQTVKGDVLEIPVGQFWMAGQRRQKTNHIHVYTVHGASFYGVRHTQRERWAGDFQETGAGTELIRHIHEQVYVDLYFCH